MIVTYHLINHFIMKTKNTFLIFLLGMLGAFILLSVTAFDKPGCTCNERSVNKLFTSPSMPGHMTLFGEKVPLERRDIREALDRELIYNYYSQGHIIYLLKLA